MQWSIFTLQPFNSIQLNSERRPVHSEQLYVPPPAPSQRQRVPLGPDRHEPARREGGRGVARRLWPVCLPQPGEEPRITFDEQLNS